MQERQRCGGVIACDRLQRFAVATVKNCVGGGESNAFVFTIQQLGEDSRSFWSVLAANGGDIDGLLRTTERIAALTRLELPRFLNVTDSSYRGLFRQSLSLELQRVVAVSFCRAPFLWLLA